MDKRGQAFSVGTLIALVIGIAIIIFIIYAYVTQGSIINVFVRKPNVDAVITACNNLCTLGNSYDYCTNKRVVRYYDKDNKLKSVSATCYELSEKYGELGIPDLGIPKCPSIDCSSESKE